MVEEEFSLVTSDTCPALQYRSTLSIMVGEMSLDPRGIVLWKGGFGLNSILRCLKLFFFLLLLFFFFVLLLLLLFVFFLFFFFVCFFYVYFLLASSICEFFFSYFSQLRNEDNGLMYVCAARYDNDAELVDNITLSISAAGGLASFSLSLSTSLKILAFVRVLVWFVF